MARNRKVEEENDNETIVKVGKTGGKVETYSLMGDEPTVSDALEAAGITLSKGDRIRVNGDAADEDDAVYSDDIVTIAGKVSGGSN